jgi:hypothetical protein
VSEYSILLECEVVLTGINSHSLRLRPSSSELKTEFYGKAFVPDFFSQYICTRLCGVTSNNTVNSIAARVRSSTSADSVPQRQKRHVLSSTHKNLSKKYTDTDNLTPLKENLSWNSGSCSAGHKIPLLRNPKFHCRLTVVHHCILSRARSIHPKLSHIRSSC